MSIATKQSIWVLLNTPTDSGDKPAQFVNQFNEDLCGAFVSVNIPLGKLRNTELVNFLEKYVKEKVLDESTLRKNAPQLCKRHSIDSGLK